MFINKKYFTNYEKLNSLTHGFGALMSIIGVFFLISFANIYGSFLHILSCSIYGATLILLYMSSAFYHGAEKTDIKKILEKFDHSSIFLLIAGSYTPFTMVILKGSLGWGIFAFVWSIAALGIYYKIYHIEKFKKLSTALYLSMGWIIVLAIKPIISNLAFNGFFLLMLGGVFYTVGVLFYLMDKRPYFHPIWHLFVLAGSISHFFSIMYYVIPTKI